MAFSLLQHSSSTISVSFSSSFSYSLFPGSSHSSTLRAQGFAHHSCTRISVKCHILEASDFGNEKPIIHVLNKQTLPKCLQFAGVKKSVNRNGNQLKLFFSSANHVLSQQIAQYMGLELRKLSIKQFTNGEIYPVTRVLEVAMCNLYS